MVSDHRDGEQLVNRIPNCSLLTNKLGLFNSLSEYSRVNAVLKGDKVRTKLSDFLPETYRLDHVKDKENFLDIYKGESDVFRLNILFRK